MFRKALKGKPGLTDGISRRDIPFLSQKTMREEIG